MQVIAALTRATDGLTSYGTRCSVFVDIEFRLIGKIQCCITIGAELDAATCTISGVLLISRITVNCVVRVGGHISVKEFTYRITPVGSNQFL